MVVVEQSAQSLRDLDATHSLGLRSTDEPVPNALMTTLAVLFYQVGNHTRLLAANPAGERSQEELKVDGLNHATSVSDHRQAVVL
jgi:hypothetical protein